jgi:ABC-type transport system involved in multi-copper enzyme maturation permease subunit
MFNLLKMDLKRLFKDKLFLVLCILAGVFALITPLLYKGLSALMQGEDLLGMFSAKDLFFRSFVPGDNLGLIAPVLVAIVICKDFRYGTVRNKIIGGHSRAAIFTSTFLTCAIALCSVMFASGLLTLGFSLCFFDYQQEAFTWTDFGYLVLSIGFEILVYCFIAAFTAFLCVFMKNVGLVIVGYVAIAFFFTIVGAVTMVAIKFAGNTGELGYELLCFINHANVFSSTVIGSGSYGLRELIYILTPSIGGTALFAWLGVVVFKKKDLK